MIPAPVAPARNTKSAVGEDEQTNMYRKMPEDLKQRALSMLKTEDIDTVAATLRIRKAALLKMIKDEAVDIAPQAAMPPLATAVEVYHKGAVDKLTII